MSIKAIITLTLLSQTPHYRDTETWSEREERLVETSEAVDDASLRATCQGPYAPKEGTPGSPASASGETCTRIWPDSQKSLAMLLVTQAILETHLSAEIHHNRCRLEIGECDSRWYYAPQTKTRVYVQRSFSPWQIKLFEDIPQEDWAEIREGVPGTQAAAWHAARRLSSGYRSCGSIDGAISRYAMGNGCKWAGAKERLELYQALMSKSTDELKRAQERQEQRVLERQEQRALELTESLLASR